ncbi:MAG: MFS transporter [Deltaproteobacteria bacterium]|nr:MFS transporter [Deltaproteobacteria bacterium]
MSEQRTPAVQGALFAVVVLTAMNLLNYIDRWVPSAVKDLFKADLHLTDTQTSLPLSAFILVYMVASPIFGSLADKAPRKVLIAAGVAIWSLATAAAAFANDFTTLLIARAAVGIGEAAYATIAPAILADYFPPEKRNRIFTIFYIATPVGSAIGFVLGGVLGAAWGWRAAFLAVGLPGLLVALLALVMRDPPRGQFDAESAPPPPWGVALRQLANNRAYLYTVAGYVAVTFATGGIADWFATYLSRHRGFELAHAAAALGQAAVIGGIVGTALGGVLADRLKGRVRQPYLFVSAFSMLPAAALALVALYVVEGAFAIMACVTAAQVFLWMYNAPVNALIVNSVDAGMRARAFGLSILAIHVLGDVLSPPLIGAISDATDGNLPLALALVPVFIVLGGVVWAIGWRRVD